MSIQSSLKQFALFLGVVVGLWLFIRLGHQSASRADMLVIYSGRSEELVAPLLRQFSDSTGIPIAVRYGQTAEMAATILEEGARSPAAILLAQEVGALATLAAAGRLTALPADVLNLVPASLVGPGGEWIGISGRARVILYHPERVSVDELPESLDELLDPRWRGLIGWAPANASFQAFITHLRSTRGEASTREWLTRMRDHGARAYAKNTPILMAVATGEIELGLVNHYYLHALQQQRPDLVPLRNHYPQEGTLLNFAGVGILDTASNQTAAESLVRFLISEKAQRYFAERTFEYPAISAGTSDGILPALPSAERVEMSDLADLEGTLHLLQELNIL